MRSSQRTISDSFIRRAVIVVALIAIVAFLIYFSWQIADILVLLFAGILFGVFLTGISGWLRQRTPLSHRQALGVTILALLIIVGVAGWLAAPNLVEQSEQLGQNLQDSIERLQTTLENQEWADPILRRLPEPDELGSVSSDFMGRLSGVFSRTFGMLTNVVLILFVGFYFAFEPDSYANGALKLVPPTYRHRAGEVLDEAAHTLRWWLVGRLASMALVGVFAAIGLSLLGIPLAFILGVLAALLAFIPVIGSALGVVPPVLIAFTISSTKALYVLLLFVGIQTVESYFITPLIQRRTVSLPPALLLLAQAVFAVFFSFIGIAMAAPVTAVLLVIVKMLYIKDILGDEETDLVKDRPDDHFEASSDSRRRAESGRQHPQRT